MTTDEQLEAEIAKMRAQREADREIENLLQLDESLVKLLHVRHKTHRSLLVKSRLDNFGQMAGSELVDTLEKVRPWSVAAERVKCPMFTPTWMPLPINFSNDKGQGKVIGLATVRLRQNGGDGYDAQSVGVWLELGQLGYVDVEIPVILPTSWRGRNYIGGYSSVTGEPCSCKAHPPAAILPAQEHYWDRTTKGTYDLYAHWETLEGFVTDWMTLR